MYVFLIFACWCFRKQCVYACGLTCVDENMAAYDLTTQEPTQSAAKVSASFFSNIPAPNQKWVIFHTYTTKLNNSRKHEITFIDRFIFLKNIMF